MPVRFTDSITITSGGGPNPTDSFSLQLVVADTVPATTDATSFGFTFPETVPEQSETVRLGLTFEDTVAAVTDALVSLGIGAADTVDIATDLATFLINLSLSDTIGAQSETVSLAFTLPETVPVQTEERTATATFREGATTAASTGTHPWVNPTNAQGLNGVGGNATSSDTNAINTHSSALTLDPYPDPVSDFSSWTITSVTVSEYASYTPGVLPAAGSWILQWRIGTGTYTNLESLNAAFNSLTTPKVFDITAGIAGSWANLDGFNARVLYISGLAETSSAAVDAIVLTVVATKTSF